MIPQDILERMVKLADGPISVPDGERDGEFVYVVDGGGGAYCSRYGFSLTLYGDVNPQSQITAVVDREGGVFVPGEDTGGQTPEGYHRYNKVNSPGTVTYVRELEPGRVCRWVEAVPPARGELVVELKDLKKALAVMPEYLYWHVVNDKLTMGANGTVVSLSVRADVDMHCRVSRDLLKAAAAACGGKVLRIEVVDKPIRPARTLLCWLEPGFRMYLATAAYLFINAMGWLTEADCLRVAGRQGDKLICEGSEGQVEFEMSERRWAEIRRIGLAVYYRLEADFTTNGWRILPGTWWYPQGITVVCGRQALAIHLDDLIAL